MLRVVYSHCATRQDHYHCSNLRHRALFLLALASQTNQEHTSASMSLHILHRHTALGLCNCQKHKMSIDLFQQPFHKSIGAYTDQEYTLDTFAFLIVFSHIFLTLYSSGTYFNVHGNVSTALLQIFRVLCRSETNSNNRSPSLTSVSCIFLV